VVLGYVPILVASSTFYFHPADNEAGVIALWSALPQLVLYWQPALNPLVTMVTICAYRRFLRQLLLFCCGAGDGDGPSMV
jgi:hypothetical protein